jgi:hypothetical protein
MRMALEILSPSCLVPVELLRPKHNIDNCNNAQLISEIRATCGLQPCNHPAGTYIYSSRSGKARGEAGNTRLYGCH